MIKRIKAIFLQEYFITRRSLETMADIIWFPLMSTAVFGFIAIYLSKSTEGVFAKQLMAGYVLWEVFRITQYAITIPAMWNIWSHNITNLFITPLSVEEYLLSQFISSIFKSLIILFLNVLLLYFFFNFNMLSLGFFNLCIYLANLMLFSWSLGAIFLGIILRVGIKVQSISWGLIYLFQPLTASIFPVSILPPFLQSVSRLFPVTYIFELVRANIAGAETNWQYVMIAFSLNLVYFVAAMIGFKYLYNKSRESGQFAKNDLQ